MPVIILSIPPETSQEEADRLLAAWRLQREAGIKPENRALPDDKFNRDLAILRQVMSRS